jgi:anti-sigma B factor antagonist
MAARTLDLQVATTAGYTVVEVGGEVDVATAPQLRACLDQAINAGSPRLVVDLRQASFIDSIGLGVLIGARRHLLAHPGHDGSVQLVCAEGLVLRVLRLTGLDGIFALHATLSDALGGETGQADDQPGHGDGHPDPAPA